MAASGAEVDRPVQMPQDEFGGWEGIARQARHACSLSIRVAAVAVFVPCARTCDIRPPARHQNSSVAPAVALPQRPAAAALFSQSGSGAGAARADIIAAAADLSSLRQIYRRPVRVPAPD